MSFVLYTLHNEYTAKTNGQFLNYSICFIYFLSKYNFDKKYTKNTVQNKRKTTPR